MVTTTRMTRPWRPWLAVLIVLGVLTIGAVVPDLARAGGRVLTPQDVVSIKVVNQPDMDTTARVETDGTISFPYVGRIRAAGLSEDQVARAIEKQLAARQIVTEPHVLVEISTFGTQASVQGQVGAPGVYTLDRPTNLTQLISRAGGLREVAVGGTITVRRAGGGVLKFDSKDVQAGHGPGANLQIASRDEVFVDLAPFYYLYGSVNNPGQFQLLRPLTVQQAIAIGGGLTPLGAQGRIRIKRKSGNGQTYEVPASFDDQVEAGDTIIIPRRIFGGTELGVGSVY